MKIEHAALYTEDLERMRSFFMKYFEASSNELYHNPKTGFTSYFLSFQEGTRLEIMFEKYFILYFHSRENYLCL